MSSSPIYNIIVYLAVGILAALVLTIIVLVVGHFTGVWVMTDHDEPATYDDDEEEYDDDDDEEEEEEYDDDEEEYRWGKFVIMMPVEQRDYIAELEDRRRLLRAKSPHLYADDWFDTCYREYSIHAVRHEQELAAFRKEMGLAA
jgi:hypothetical protein